jgi:plastocyanin
VEDKKGSILENAGSDRVFRRIMLLIVLAFLAGVLVVATRTEKAKADTVNLTLYGSAIYGWGYTSGNITSPGPTIIVTQNDYVNLTLISQDGAPHQFYVDYNGNGAIDAGEPASSGFTSTAIFGFTANTTGTFTYHCSVHPAVMYGTFIVKQAVPEFPSFILLLPFAIATLLAVTAYKAKRRS